MTKSSMFNKSRHPLSIYSSYNITSHQQNQTFIPSMYYIVVSLYIDIIKIGDLYLECHLTELLSCWFCKTSVNTKYNM